MTKIFKQLARHWAVCLVVFLTLLITRQWGGLFLFLLALYLMFR